MKCVCKVLIYHPPKTQHFIMIWRCCSRPWMLWGSAPHKSENINTQEWLILPPFVVGGLVIIHSIDANWRICVLEPLERFIAPDASSLKIDLFLGIIACGRKKCIAHRIFHGVWLGNHLFYLWQMKDLCSRAFWASLSIQMLPPLKLTFT